MRDSELVRMTKCSIVLSVLQVLRCESSKGVSTSMLSASLHLRCSSITSLPKDSTVFYGDSLFGYKTSMKFGKQKLQLQGGIHGF